MSKLIAPKLIYDSSGKAVEVILSIAEYLDMLEQLDDFEDLRTIRERLATPQEFVSWEELETELKSEGKL